MTSIALIVAAGRGLRARPVGVPKQYANVGGRPVLAHAIAAFVGHPGVHRVLVVCHPDDALLYDRAVAGFEARLLPAVAGGATRQESVRLGLEALVPRRPDRVLVHDAARPFVSAAVISGVLAALDNADGAIAAVPVADTLKSADDRRVVRATIPRTGLWRAQTPQGFAFSTLLQAHRSAAAAGRTDFTDDAEIAEWCGIEVALVAGSELNSKITTTEDLAMAEQRLSGPAPETRTGQGFDVHRFAPGDHIWLCGVRVAHTHGVEAHSDGDVGLHALTDALLGAIVDGDIGQHFKPTDPQWRGAPSAMFLADAARRVRAAGGRIVNVDVTVLCEEPRIAIHRALMRARVAEILEIEPERVSVKATTTERLGFTGRREGIAAMAIATVVLPARG